MKTKGYISVYTLIIFVLLVSIITVLAMGIRLESKKVINKEAYYQNKLIARSIYYRVLNDEKFNDFLEDPTEYNLTQIKIDNLGLDCYDKVPSLNFENGKRGPIIRYQVKYKGTSTLNNICFEKNDSEVFNDKTKIKISEDELEKILDNSLEEVSGDLVFYNSNNQLFYLENSEYEKLLEEIKESIKQETSPEEDLDKKNETTEPVTDENVKDDFDINIEEYLEYFHKVEGEKFYRLKGFQVLSETNPKLKGIVLLEPFGERSGHIVVRGLLINQADYMDMEVYGKVLDMANYKGDAKYNKANIDEALKYTKFDNRFKSLGLIIK